MVSIQVGFHGWGGHFYVLCFFSCFRTFRAFWTFCFNGVFGWEKFIFMDEGKFLQIKWLIFLTLPWVEKGNDISCWEMEVKCTLKLKFALVNNVTYYRIHIYITIQVLHLGKTLIFALPPTPLWTFPTCWGIIQFDHYLTDFDQSLRALFWYQI